MNRRWRNLLVRRGRFFPRVPTPSWVPPGFIEQPGPKPRQGRTRRGRFWTVVPAQQAAPPPPAFVPSQVGKRHPLFALARRGLIQQVPLAAPAVVPAQIGKRHPLFALARRGAFWKAPIVGRAPGQVDAPDRIKSQRLPRLFALARRGAFWKVPIVGRAPGQVDAPDRFGKPVQGVSLARRGARWSVPLAAPAVPPAQFGKPVQAVSLVRRGARWAVPPAVVVAAAPAFPPPRTAQPRNRWLPPARRGAEWKVPLVGLAPASTGVPDRIGKPRVRTLSVRRGSGWALPYPVYGPPPARIIRSGRSQLPPSSRGRRPFQVPPAVQRPERRPTTRPTARGLLPRRGRFQPGPFGRVAPAIVPVFVTRRAARWAVRWRRGGGRFQRIPLVGATLILPPPGIGVPQQPIRVAIRVRPVRLATGVDPVTVDVDSQPVRVANSVPALLVTSAEKPALEGSTVGTPVFVNFLRF